jgi:TusE/DsrC/DsvC family sulfur relay protein
VADPDQTAASGHVLRRIGGREVLFDAEGFLIDPQVWTEAVAETLAAEQGLAALDEPHWRVILFLRKFYLAQGKSPLSREVKAGTGLSLMEIDALFPGGLKRGARRLAGLPNPRGCM